MRISSLAADTTVRAILIYLAVWGVAVTYLAATGGEWTFPIASLLIFGLAFSGIIWAVTRKMNAPPVPIADPKRESIGLLAYLAVYAVVLIGFGLGALKQTIPAGPAQELAVLAYKLAIHVGVPVAIIMTLGGAVRPLFDAGLSRRGFWLAFGRSERRDVRVAGRRQPIAGANRRTRLVAGRGASVGFASWMWLSLEAGLCEEFLFRVCLQSRLAAWLQSPAGAIVLTSILFGLAHWPGLYLRGGPDVDGWSTDPLQVAAFTIATLSPLSISLGLLWHGSRSLLLVALVHGAIDACRALRNSCASGVEPAASDASLRSIWRLRTAANDRQADQIRLGDAGREGEPRARPVP